MEYIVYNIPVSYTHLIPLDGFPKRPNKTTRVGLSVEFLDERTMVVNIKDKGFGELFPASEASVRQEVML